MEGEALLSHCSGKCSCQLHHHLLPCLAPYCLSLRLGSMPESRSLSPYGLTLCERQSVDMKMSTVGYCSRYSVGSLSQEVSAGKGRGKGEGSRESDADM